MDCKLFGFKLCLYAVKIKPESVKVCSAPEWELFVGASFLNKRDKMGCLCLYWYQNDVGFFLANF